jgi:hypothetical protein
MQWSIIKKLGSEEWGTLGVSRGIPLGQIPDGVGDLQYVCRKLILDIQLNISQGSAAEATLLEMARCITNLQLQVAGVNVLNSINLEHFLALLGNSECRHGEDMDLPSTPGVGTDTVERHFQVVVPFAREEFWRPNDFAVPGKLFNGKYLYMTPVDALSQGSLDSASMTVWAECELTDKVQLTALPIWEVVDKGPDLQLPAGVYSDLLIYKPTGGFTAGDITTVQLTAGGIDLYDHVHPDAILTRYRWARSGTAELINSIWGAVDGESWSEHEANFYWLPLVFSYSGDNRNRVVNYLDTFGSLLDYQINGNLDPVRWCSKRFAYLTDNLARREAIDLGISDVEGLTGHRATASGRDVQGSGESAYKAGIKVLPTTITGIDGRPDALPARVARTASIVNRKLRTASRAAGAAIAERAKDGAASIHRRLFS